MMKKWILIMMMFMLIGCTDKQRIIDGIDMTKGTLVKSVNTVGWFGDGEICEQYDFSTHPIYSFEKPFIPIDDIFKRLLNDYIHDELFEEINDGYYCLIDKQEKDTDLFERYSMNIIMIIYNTQNHQLYYLELNT